MSRLAAVNPARGPADRSRRGRTRRWRRLPALGPTLRSRLPSPDSRRDEVDDEDDECCEDSD